LPDNLLVGIDVGTSSVKAILIDGAGSLLADFARPVAMSRPAAGYAEQNPTDWTDGIHAALTAFAARHNLSGLVGIGITSQVNTHVFVDSGGAALTPAITWQDTRCAADAATLAEQVGSAQRASRFGRPALIDASHTLARMAYVARVHRDVYAKTRHVLLPKDYCVMQLTGAVLSDAISAVRLAGPSGYVDELLDLVPRSRELLPGLQRFHHVAGQVREGMPCAGTPVVVGAMDAWAGMFGSGVLGDGDAMYQSGTSEILGIVWCQIRADALGFALQRTSVLDAAVLGAAILAGLGAETVSSIGDAVRQLVKFGRTFEPQAAYHAYYDEKFGQFQALYTALRSVDARYEG
jgi:xylulokinase